MIDLKHLRDHAATTKQQLALRGEGWPDALDEILALDAERRALVQRVERDKATRNTESKEVGRRRKAGEGADELLVRLKALSDAIKDGDERLNRLDDQLRDRLLRVPNVPLPSVPEGDASHNTVVRTEGTAPTFTFAAKPHHELMDALHLVDLPRGAKVTGSGFPFYRGLGARMVRSLINFMMDLHVERGYEEVWPPALINGASGEGTGQLPDLENQMYVTGEELYLVPTAEVPVTNLHRDEILAARDLPKAYVAYSPCFRREAGAHGKETRGITRVHQFDKVELVRLVTPDSSLDELESMLDHAEAVLRALELPYRIVELATGDLGFASAKTFDIEVWAPGAEAWLEVSSASCFTDFQARRANIRFRPPGGKPDFVHTLNASGLALPRTIIAILENYQLADGSVVVPEALRAYMRCERLMPDGL